MPKLTEIVDERLGNALLSYEAFDAWTLKWWSILVTIPVLLYGWACMLTTLTPIKSVFLPALPHTILWICLWWPLIALFITYAVWGLLAYTIMKLTFHFLKFIYYDLYKGL